jgi:hypothetical protein
MAAKTFLRLVAGRKTEIAGVVTSAGAGNDGDIPALDSTGRLDTTVMPIGVVADNKSIVSSESLSAGNFVNVWDDGGTIKVRKADATAAGKEADGFVLAGVTAPAAALVYFEGTNTQLTSLTLGARYYLDTTAGAVVATTPPSGSGNVVQYIGRAVSTTELTFEPDDGVVLV